MQFLLLKRTAISISKKRSQMYDFLHHKLNIRHKNIPKNAQSTPDFFSLSVRFDTTSCKLKLKDSKEKKFFCMNFLDHKKHRHHCHNPQLEVARGSIQNNIWRYHTQKEWGGVGDGGHTQWYALGDIRSEGRTQEVLEGAQVMIIACFYQQAESDAARASRHLRTCGSHRVLV